MMCCVDIDSKQMLVEIGIWHAIKPPLIVVLFMLQDRLAFSLSEPQVESR